MKIGAAKLIHAWGRDMTLSRGGVPLVNFKGRLYNNRPETDMLDSSVDQHLFRVIAVYDDFAGSPAVVPQKFDVILDVAKGNSYTVQQAFTAGADVDEVIRMVVKGGQS